MSNVFRNIAVAIITPTHTKHSFDIGLQLSKKFDSELTIVECMFKIQPKLYFFETKTEKKIAQSQVYWLSTQIIQLVLFGQEGSWKDLRILHLIMILLLYKKWSPLL